MCKIMVTRIKILFIILTLLFLLHATILCIDGFNDNIQKADVGLILGSKVHVNGSPSIRLANRMDKGVQLYKEKFVPKLIVSGAIGKEGHDEAIVMKNYLITKGVKEDDIIVDSNGKNTYQSALFTKKIMLKNKWTSVIVISNYYHITRSKLALSKFGVPVVYKAHSTMIHVVDLFSIPREVVAYYYYLFRSY